MATADHPFPGRSGKVSGTSLDDLLAEASRQEAWRDLATRSLLDDLRAGLSPAVHAPLRAGSAFADDTSPEDSFAAASAAEAEMFLAGPGRKKAGERRRQILSAFVEMLESHKEERITTSSLARHLALSEAAIYRQFDSKSDMLEHLIVFMEDSVFEQIGQLNARLAQHAVDARVHTAMVVTMLMKFAETNPGVSRVMAGDALVLEEEFLRDRMGLFFARFEDLLAERLRGQQSVRQGGGAALGPDGPAVLASALCAFCVGRLMQFARSGFRSLPSKELDACLATMLR